MKKFSSYILSLLVLCGCIDNDLPYPVVPGEFASLEVDDAVSVNIDASRRSVRIEMKESADLSKVRVSSATYTGEPTSCEPEIVGVHDFRSASRFVLHTYQDYPWTVTATLPIERYFSVKGQIGSTVIDDVNRRVVAYVSPSVDLGNVEVLSMKLGPEGCSYEPSMDRIHDFVEGALVKVRFNGSVEEWYLYLEQAESAVSLEYASAWTRCVWLSGNGVEGADNGFMYRPRGASEWTPVPGVHSDGGTFSACLDGLEPETAYECLAYSGSDRSAPVDVVTAAEAQLPNSGFEAFSNAESSVYSSWFDPSAAAAELKTKWWDSGNVGSTTVGSAYCIAAPDIENHVEGSASAQLISRNVIIKFAAGNTFSGEFAGLVGTKGGLVNFGRPWTLRPRSMRVWLKYECGAIDVVDTYPSGEPVKLGDPDNCQAWIALGDWDCRKYGGSPDCPVQVNTTDKSTFFDPASESVIAYGSFTADCSSDSWESKYGAMVTGTAPGGWVELEIPFEYTSVLRVPTHIIVSFASSRLGDYFTGSSQSRLWVDGIRLVY